MAFNPALLAEVGKFTKASDYNNLKDNVEWLQEKADVGHNLDATTGTGHHRGSWQDPMIWVTDTSGGQACSIWIDNSGATKRLRVKFGANASAVAPSGESDPTSFIIILAQTQATP